MKKLRKVSRYWTARLRSKRSVPFYWHIGTPNFGDDLNPFLFELIAKRPIRLEVRRDRAHFLGMGSILDKASAQSTVIGSGLLQPILDQTVRFHEVVSVRGALTRESISGGEHVLLGDPMVLLDHFLPDRCDKSGPIGFVPHVRETRKAREYNLKDVVVIDPAQPPQRVIKKIAKCSRIFSQSLHGLIVADALDVPNVWIEPGSSMEGGRFKFDDYFSTLDEAKIARAPNKQTFLEAKRTDFTVSKFAFDKRDLLEAMTQTIGQYADQG